MIWTPNPFQPEMVNWLLDNEEAMLWAGCGSGKTVTSLTAVSELILQGICRGVLVIAPFRVLATSFPAQVEKWDHLQWMTVANMRTPEGQRMWEEGSADIYMVNSELLPTITRNLTCRKCKGTGCEVCGDGFTVSTTPGFVDKFIKKRKTLPVDILLVDECFPAGTLVDTPSGPTCIENLRKGDCILNVTGKDSINQTLKNEVHSVTKIQCGGKTLHCSSSHKFLTTKGWKEAKSLQETDTLVANTEAVSLLRSDLQCDFKRTESAPLRPVVRGENDSPHVEGKSDGCMRVVWGGLSSETPNQVASFLRDILLREMADEESPTPSGNGRRAKTPLGEAQEVVGIRFGQRLENDKTYHGALPHEEPRICGEAKSDTEADRTQASCAGRERKACPETPAGVSGGDGVGGILGVCDPHECKERTRTPDPLQDRHRGPKTESSYRSGWAQPSQQARTGEGCSEGRFPFGTRVESVEVLEQGHPDLDQFRDAEGRIYFYDLEVRRHPSYSVEGFVVHNCSLAKNPSSVRFNALRPYLHDIEKVDGKKNFRSPFRRKFSMTGTPHPNSYLDLFAQVRLIDGGKRFGTAFTRYRDLYFKSDYMGFKWELKPGAKEIIDAKIADLALVMPPECYPDLPPCITEDVEITLPAEAMKAYRVLEKELLVELATGTIVALSAAALTTKLLQLTSGQVLDSERGIHVTHDAKLKALHGIRKKHPKEPLIVFTSYIHERERILKEFPEAAEFDEKRIPEWQAGKIPMWVSDCRSMAFGIDGLQVGGRICVWMTPTYSWEMYHQAISRLVRVGQDQETLIYRVLALGTVDEAVVAAVTSKEEGNSGLLESLKNLQRLRKSS